MECMRDIHFSLKVKLYEKIFFKCNAFLWKLFNYYCHEIEKNILLNPFDRSFLVH